MLVVANPTYDLPQAKNIIATAPRPAWQFDSLPSTEVEARQIQSIYSGVDLITRNDATETAIKNVMPQYQILHFSTHGFVDSTFGAFSGLALALSKEAVDDGRLMGYEIIDSGLDCDLVTMSACETGQGRIVEGEGVLGLPRLFLGAGAKSVLMSLWKVHDRFAADFMPKFYRGYLIDKKSKSEALGLAKRQVLDAKIKPGQKVYYQHPFYWATFTLFGDPGFERKSNYSFWWLLIIFLTVAAGIYFARTRRHR